MFREILSVLQGALIWQIFCIQYHVNEKKAVLVLVNDNRRLDAYALAHLEDFMDRKYAEGTILLFSDENVRRLIQKAGKTYIKAPARLCRWPKKRIEKLYRYYSFYKFSDRIVFTYTDSPKDNRLGRALRETQITEEEAVCLGLYRLRKIPPLGDVMKSLFL